MPLDVIHNLSLNVHVFLYVFEQQLIFFVFILTIGLKFCITDKRVIPHAPGLGFHAPRARAWGLIRAARDDDPPLDEGVRRYAKLLVSRIGFWKNVFFLDFVGGEEILLRRATSTQENKFVPLSSTSQSIRRRKLCIEEGRGRRGKERVYLSLSLLIYLFPLYLSLISLVYIHFSFFLNTHTIIYYQTYMIRTQTYI